MIRKAKVIVKMYNRLQGFGFNTALLSVNMCLTCEEELSKEIYGYTNYVIKHGNMLINPTMDKKECIICHMKK